MASQYPVKKLGDVADFVRGITFKPDDVIEIDTANAVACLRTKNVQSDLDLSDVWGVPASFVKRDEQYLREGDILVSSANSWNLVGKCSWVPKLPWRATIGGFISCLRSKGHFLDERYLFHWFSSEPVQALVRNCARKTTNISNLSFDQCLALEIPRPPLLEQKRVAAILDQADDIRRKRQHAIDRLNQLGQAIFHEMFGHMSRLRRTHTFEEVATIQQSLVDPKLPQYKTELHVGPEHIVSGEGAINWEKVRTAEEDNVISGKNKFKAGDVIYSKIRPKLNKVAIADREGICSADMYVIQPTAKKSNSQFLRMLLMGPDFLAYAETCSNRANIPKLNRKQVESYCFHCPSFEAQEEYAKRLIQLQQVSGSSEASGEVTSALFASLQHRAFTGQL